MTGVDGRLPKPPRPPAHAVGRDAHRPQPAAIPRRPRPITTPATTVSHTPPPHPPSIADRAKHATERNIDMAIKHGTAGADTLIGNSVADQLFGEAGNDVLKGLAGADTLDGGGDTDTATYAGSAQAVTVRLDIRSGAGGDAAGDTYVSIENVVGSSGADTLVGNGLGNRLDGGLGADIFTGGAGNDTLNAGDGLDTLAGGSGADVLNGGAGFDFAEYRTSVTGVNVNLATGATGGDEAGGETVAGIEGLKGPGG